MAAVPENDYFEGFTEEMHETTRKIRIELLKVQQDVAAKESEQLSSDNSEDDEEKESEWLSSDNSEDEEESDRYDFRVFEDEKFNNDDNHLTKDLASGSVKKHKRDEKNADENHDSESVAAEVSLDDWRTEDMVNSHLASEDTAEKTEDQNLIYCHISESEPLTLQAYCNGRKHSKPLQEEFEGFTHEDEECSTLDIEPLSQDLFHPQEHLLPSFIQSLQEFEGFTQQDREFSNKIKKANVKVREGLGGCHNANLTQARKWTMNLQEKLTKQDRQQLWEVKERQYYSLSHIFVNDHIEWLKMSQALLKQTFSGCPKDFTQYQDLVKLEVAVYSAMVMGNKRHQQFTNKNLYTSLHPVIRNKISEHQMQKLLLMSPLYYFDVSKKIWQRTSEVLETDPKFRQHHMIQWLGVLDLRKAWAWTGHDMWIWAEEVRAECMKSILSDGTSLSLDEVSREISYCIFIPESQELLHLAHFTLCYARKFRKSHDQISDMDFKLEHLPAIKNTYKRYGLPAKNFQKWKLLISDSANEKNLESSLKNKKTRNSMKEEDVLEKFIDKCANSEGDSVGGHRSAALNEELSHSDDGEPVVNGNVYNMDLLSTYISGKRNPTEKSNTKLPSQLNTDFHNFIDAEPMRNKEMVTYSINTTDMVSYGTDIDKVVTSKWKIKPDHSSTASDCNQGQIQQCTQLMSTSTQPTSTSSMQSTSKLSLNTLATLCHSAKGDDNLLQSRMTESLFANLNERTPFSMQTPFAFTSSQASKLHVVNTVSTNGNADGSGRTLPFKQSLSVVRTNQFPKVSVIKRESSSVSHKIEPMAGTKKASASYGARLILPYTKNNNNITQLLCSNCKKHCALCLCNMVERVAVLKASATRNPSPITPNACVIPVLKTNQLGHQRDQSSISLHHCVSTDNIPRFRIKAIAELTQGYPSEKLSDDNTSLQVEHKNQGLARNACFGTLEKSSTSTAENIPVTGILVSEPSLGTRSSQLATVSSLPAWHFPDMTSHKDKQVHLSGSENLEETTAPMLIKSEMLDQVEMKGNTEVTVGCVTDQDTAKRSTYSAQDDQQFLNVPSTILNHKCIESMTKEIIPRQQERFDSQNPAHQKAARKVKMGIIKNSHQAKNFAEKKYFNKRKQVPPVINTSYKSSNALGYINKCGTGKTSQSGEKQQRMAGALKSMDTGTINIHDRNTINALHASVAEHSQCMMAGQNERKTHPIIRRVSSSVYESQTMFSQGEAYATEDAGLDDCIRIGQVVSMTEREFGNEKDASLIPTVHFSEEIFSNVPRSVLHTVHPPSLSSSITAAELLTTVSTTSLATNSSQPTFTAPQVATSSCQPSLTMPGKVFVTAAPHTHTAINQPPLLFSSISTANDQSLGTYLSTYTGPLRISTPTDFPSTSVESNPIGQPTASVVNNTTDLPNIIKHAGLTSYLSVPKPNGLTIASVPTFNIPPRLPTVISVSTPFDKPVPQSVFLPTVSLWNSTDCTPDIQFGVYTSRADTSIGKSADPSVCILADSTGVPNMIGIIPASIHNPGSAIKKQPKNTLLNMKCHDRKQDCRYKEALENYLVSPSSIYTPAGSSLRTSVSVVKGPSLASKIYAPAGLPFIPKLQTTTGSPSPSKVAMPAGKLSAPRIATLAGPSSVPKVTTRGGPSLVPKLPVSTGLSSAPGVTIPACSSSVKFNLHAISPLTPPPELSSAPQFHIHAVSLSHLATNVSSLTASLSLPRVSVPPGASLAPRVFSIPGSATPRVLKPSGSSIASRAHDKTGSPSPRVTTPAVQSPTPSVTTPAVPSITSRVTTHAVQSLTPRVTTTAAPSLTSRVTTPAVQSLTPRVTTPPVPSLTSRVTTPAVKSLTPRNLTPAVQLSTPRVTTPAVQSSTTRETSPAVPSPNPRVSFADVLSSVPIVAAVTSSVPRVTTHVAPLLTSRRSSSPTSTSGLTQRITKPVGSSFGSKVYTLACPTAAATTSSALSSRQVVSPPTNLKRSSEIPTSTNLLTSPVSSSLAVSVKLQDSSNSSKQALETVHMTEKDHENDAVSTVKERETKESKKFTCCRLAVATQSPTTFHHKRRHGVIKKYVRNQDWSEQYSGIAGLCKNVKSKAVGLERKQKFKSNLRNMSTRKSGLCTGRASKHVSKVITCQNVHGSDGFRSTNGFQQCPSVRIMESPIQGISEEIILEVNETGGQHSFLQQSLLEKCKGALPFEKVLLINDDNSVCVYNSRKSTGTGVKRKRECCDENSSSTNVKYAVNPFADHTYSKVRISPNSYSSPVTIKTETDRSYSKRRRRLVTGADTNQFSRCNLQCCTTFSRPSTKRKFERLDVEGVKQDEGMRKYIRGMKRIRGINYQDPEVLQRYKLPLTLGWQREVVQRASVNTEVRCDIYYHTPDGRKLRSTVEVENFLVKEGVTEVGTSNFTFWKKTLGFGAPYEFFRQAQRKPQLTQDDSVTQHRNSEVQQRSYVRRVPQWKRNKKALKPNVNQPPREWPNDGFWVTDFNDVHNSLGTDEVEIVNEAGELTGFEEWREELKAQTEEMECMHEQLLGQKMKTKRENQCMKQAQQPEELKKNSEKVTQCTKKSVSVDKINEFDQSPDPREIFLIEKSLKSLVNDKNGWSLSVTNPVLQMHEKKGNNNEQTAECLLKIPEKLLHTQLNHNQTMEKHIDLRWLSSDKSINKSIKRKKCVPETQADNSEYLSYVGKKSLPPYERNPNEVKHHAKQTHEVQSQTEEFGIKKQNASILKYVMTNTDQIEERYIENIGESQEHDVERVEAWPLDSSFPVTEKVRKELNTHSQPVEKWEHMMDGRDSYHEPKKCSVKSRREERKQRVEGRLPLNILTVDKQKDLCSLGRKSWWPASVEERRTQLLEKLKKHKEDEDHSSASVQSLQQWREARW